MAADPRGVGEYGICDDNAGEMVEPADFDNATFSQYYVGKD